MKTCSQCHNVFDDSVTFCLNDGSLLIEINEQPTIVSTNHHIKANNKQSLTNILLIALVVTLILGFLAFYLWKPEGTKLSLSNNVTSTNNQTSTVSSNTDESLRLKEKELELQEKELELKKKELESRNGISSQHQVSTVPSASRPLPPSRSNSSSNYSGSIGNTPATFYLSWNKNQTVTGSFYYNNSLDSVYTISGTNFRQGEADIKVYDGSQFLATMKIYKKIGGNKVCWSGSFDSVNGNTSPVSLCRYR